MDTSVILNKAKVLIVQLYNCTVKYNTIVQRKLDMLLNLNSVKNKPTVPLI